MAGGLLEKALTWLPMAWRMFLLIQTVSSLSDTVVIAPVTVQTQCDEPKALVCEEGATKESVTVTASENVALRQCLNSTGAWESGVSERYQWILFEMSEKNVIKWVTTQGHPSKEQWVKLYSVEYSIEGDGDFLFFVNRNSRNTMFDGNNDQHTAHLSRLPDRTVAKTVRIIPLDWHGSVSMRVELFGCKESAANSGFLSKSSINKLAKTVWVKAIIGILVGSLFCLVTVCAISAFKPTAPAEALVYSGNSSGNSDPKKRDSIQSWGSHKSEASSVSSGNET